jgi:hypothetical protein
MPYLIYILAMGGLCVCVCVCGCVQTVWTTAYESAADVLITVMEGVAVPGFGVSWALWVTGPQLHVASAASVADYSESSNHCLAFGGAFL